MAFHSALIRDNMILLLGRNLIWKCSILQIVAARAFTHEQQMGEPVYSDENYELLYSSQWASLDPADRALSIASEWCRQSCRLADPTRSKDGRGALQAADHGLHHVKPASWLQRARRIGRQAAETRSDDGSSEEGRKSSTSHHPISARPLETN